MRDWSWTLWFEIATAYSAGRVALAVLARVAKVFGVTK